MHEKLIKSLRACAENNTARVCPTCPWSLHQKGCITAMITAAADAIEKLQIVVNFHRFNSEFWKDEYNSLADEKWIPVTERSPEEKEEVLISDNSFFGGPIIAVAYLNRQKWEWRDDMCTATKPHPTHWMPMPKLPKEGT